MVWFILMSVAGGFVSGIFAGAAHNKMPEHKSAFIVIGGIIMAIYSRLLDHLYPHMQAFVSLGIFALASLIVLSLMIYFGGGGWKRLRQKTSAAKEKLLAKVREVHPSPEPVAAPV